MTMISINQHGICASVFKIDEYYRTALKTDWPPKCTPKCFAKSFEIEEHVQGVIHLVPEHKGRCEPEAARLRIARIVNETTQGFLLDTDIIYFDTF